MKVIGSDRAPNVMTVPQNSKYMSPNVIGSNICHDCAPNSKYSNICHESHRKWFKNRKSACFSIPRKARGLWWKATDPPPPRVVDLNFRAPLDII